MGDLNDKGVEEMGSDKGMELSEVVKLSSTYQPYPEALANYQEVVENQSLFFETLEKMHYAMKTKFMIPTIGGKELDLHQLFLEVTSRGGIEKVIGDRRWKEVTSAFNFPSTATNASFILRKYYISLLRHYEQIYFLRVKGWTAPSAESISAMPASIIQHEKRIECASPLPESRSAVCKRKRNNGGEAALPAGIGQELPENRTVVGVINGKFDDGYFVTVTIGSMKLKGVLFHASQENSAQRQPSADNYVTSAIHRRRRKRKHRSRDPSHPKPNRSGYNFFFSEQHAKLKQLHPRKDREISKMIGDLWSNLTEVDRAVYQEIGLKDKQRYQDEMAAYRERQRTDLVLADAMPIQERRADQSSGLQNTNPKELDGAIDMLSEDGTDTDFEKSDEEFGLQDSPEEAAAGSESAVAVDPSVFELRRRDLNEPGNENEMASANSLPQFGDHVESEGTADASSDKQNAEFTDN